MYVFFFSFRGIFSTTVYCEMIQRNRFIFSSFVLKSLIKQFKFTFLTSTRGTSNMATMLCGYDCLNFVRKMREHRLV